MKLSRANFNSYLLSLAPMLYLAAALQVLVYHHYFPETLVQEVALFLFCGLTLLIAGFYSFARMQEVTLERNSLEVKFKFIPVKKEIYYQDVQEIRISKKKSDFGHAHIVLRSGETHKLYNLDHPELIQSKLDARKLSSF
jgi:hypothetical protein